MHRDVAYLRVINGPRKGGVFVLKDLAVFDIGRAEGCHVCIPVDSVCSSHARIYRRGNVWTFYDLNSEGGSKVNDIPVTKRDLDGGEVIRLGDVELHFAFTPPQAAPGAGAGAGPGTGAGAGQPARESTPVERAVASIEAAGSEHGGEEPTDGFHGLDLAAAFEASRQGTNDGTAITFKVRVIDGDARDLGKSIVLDPRSEYVLGRSTTCALVLNDGKVSRLHCRLEPAPGGFQVTDLNSANGSVLNGERVTQAVIKGGDYLRVGYTVVTFEVVPVALERPGGTQRAAYDRS